MTANPQTPRPDEARVGLSGQGRQPYLTDSLVTLCAPTQMWSAPDGQMSGIIDGIYLGDVRHVRGLQVSCDQSDVTWAFHDSPRAQETTFVGVLRALDTGADPKVRWRRRRRVEGTTAAETWQLETQWNSPVALTLTARFHADFASLLEVRVGALREGDAAALTVETAPGSAAASTSARSAKWTFAAEGAEIRHAGSEVSATWQVTVPARGRVTLAWSLAMEDSDLAVTPPRDPRWPAAPEAEDPSDLRRWNARAWADLGALRLCLKGSGEEFLAAGAPWFLTLFGRDSLWAARMLLEAHPELALSTLRVLAGLQGTVTDIDTAEAPGKILHEVRSQPLVLPGESVSLPPFYYGSVDSTPLWLCLFHDLWAHGDYATELTPLLPQFVAACQWMLDNEGPSGFLNYQDESGHGLSNQGWKDSGDSVQWRSGELAEGPISLCEVQAYAFEAALGAAEILETAGPTQDGPTPAELREWATRLQERFAQTFWVTTAEGHYPGIAVDGNQRVVDSLTSNIGHLLGTGLLTPAQEQEIVPLLLSPTMSSGFGIRTLSTVAEGYWPLSYHGGSVWAHDTAIIAWGMFRSGHLQEARQVARELVRAAAGFDYQVPELYAGDPAETVTKPVPYPAACRPQAWSAAAAIVCQEILTERP